MKNGAAKHVLVAGGAGFLGSHLCDALLAEGAHVVAVDNLMTGGRRTSPIWSGSPASTSSRRT
jgi:UDP-glucuronate decarboxylase